MDPRIVTRYHNLEFNPFTPATAGEDYFQTLQTQRILHELHFGIVSRKGFLLLLGEVGVGKTSLLMQLLQALHGEEGLHTAWVFNTSVDRLDLLKSIVSDFGLELPSGATQSELLHILHRHFLRVNQSGGNCAVIVDEAHNLSEEALESLRMLSNLEAGGRKLVQILLAGQEELQEALNSRRLRQLQSRIYLQCTLRPLERQEVHSYCSFKLSRAGAKLPFSRAAVRLLWLASRGNTRTLDLVMDRALHAMAAHGTHTVSRRIVRRALREIAPQQRFVRHNLRVSRKRTAAAVIPAAGLLLLAALLCLPHLTRHSSSALHLPHPLARWTGPTDPGTSDSPERTYPVNRSARKTPPPAGDRKSTLLQFLNTFNTVSTLPDLQQSIAERDIGPFRRSLPPGLHVAGLKEPPGKTGFRFSRLPWRKLTGRDPGWYILWDPVLELDLQHPSRSSPSDIVILQTILRDRGLYSYRIDGRYGPRTRKALRAYQRRRGLTPEQGLDARTLFALCRDFRGSQAASAAKTKAP